MAEHNGHASRDHWNVSLWLHNTEPLYRLLQDGVKSHAGDRDAAARWILARLPQRTPDGTAYTLETVRAALED